MAKTAEKYLNLELMGKNIEKIEYVDPGDVIDIHLSGGTVLTISVGGEFRPVLCVEIDDYEIVTDDS